MKRYRRIFITDCRNRFLDCEQYYDKTQDLVLTYDFGLFHLIKEIGGQCQFIDHLLSSDEMHKNNFLAYEYFRTWNLNDDGKDVFTHRGIPFGFSFRLEFWADYIFWINARLCLNELKKFTFEDIYLTSENDVVRKILSKMSTPFVDVEPSKGKKYSKYYFDFQKWMHENIRKTDLRAKLLDILTRAIGFIYFFLDYLTPKKLLKPLVFVHQYHPTKELIQRLKNEKKVRILSVSLTKNLGVIRYIPQTWIRDKHRASARRIMQELKHQCHNRLILTNGLNITDEVRDLIEDKVEKKITRSVQVLDDIVNYIDKNPISLAIFIANLGDVFSIVDCVCRERKINSFLIINGLLGPEYLDESKYATHINGYSQNILNTYFKGMPNAYALGDPRMDSYVPLRQKKMFNPNACTVTIGTAGYNNVDLNSYVAFEFDFMFDILTTLSIFLRRNIKLNLVIKVRPNGYLEQYRQFVEEYFPNVKAVFYSKTPMREVLESTDFYISTYSQTLIEAACLGIPAVYYRKDVEVIPPPFDGGPDLVTVETQEQLQRAFEGYMTGDSRFNPFLSKSILEHYIGDLNGSNVQRNLDFVYELLEGHSN